MKPNWHRASVTLINNSQEPGGVTVYFDYDLRCWLFGISISPDPYWYDLKISLGPIGFSLMYWRRYAYVYDPD